MNNFLKFSVAVLALALASYYVMETVYSVLPLIETTPTVAADYDPFVAQ